MDHLRSKAETLNSENLALRVALRAERNRTDFYRVVALLGWVVAVGLAIQAVGL